MPRDLPTVIALIADHLINATREHEQLLPRPTDHAARVVEVALVVGDERARLRPRLIGQDMAGHPDIPGVEGRDDPGLRRKDVGEVERLLDEHVSVQEIRDLGVGAAQPLREDAVAALRATGPPLFAVEDPRDERAVDQVGSGLHQVLRERAVRRGRDGDERDSRVSHAASPLAATSACRG